MIDRRFGYAALGLALAGALVIGLPSRPLPSGPAAQAPPDAAALSRSSFDLDEAADAQLWAKAVTELKADGRGHYLAQAEIEGTRIEVIVDTGASMVALSYQDAEQAGLNPHGLDYDAPVATANGLAYAARVMLRRVEVDGVAVRDVEGLVMPDGAMSGTLLGMSFLRRLSSFTFADGRLTLKD